jgi:putative glutamine amidotransferase
MISESSLLGSLLEPAEAPLVDDYLRLPINTSHHQSVAIPGEGLRIVARCPDDGVVEAVENDPALTAQFLIGVQWHPERSYDISAASRALFQRLVDEAAKATA